MEIVHIINLQKRSDRWSQITTNFNFFKVPFTRFDAIEDNNGALGCAKSHVAVLKLFDARSPALFVAEDDAKILSDIGPVVRDFMKSDAQVLMLGNNPRRTVPYSDTLCRVFQAFTTSFYVVKAQSVSKLLECFEEAVRDLELGRKNPIDVAWHRLQTEIPFVIPKKRIVRQTAGYSDIEKKYVNYGV